MTDQQNPRPVEPLDYAAPKTVMPAPEVPLLIAAAPRLIFTLGLILLCYGAGLGLRDLSDAEAFMGWGAFFVGVTARIGPRWPRPKHAP